MNKIFKDEVIECLKCVEFLRTHRRKCPYCGLTLISTNNVQNKEDKPAAENAGDPSSSE